MWWRASMGLCFPSSFYLENENVFDCSIPSNPTQMDEHLILKRILPVRLVFHDGSVMQNVFEREL